MLAFYTTKVRFRLEKGKFLALKFTNFLYHQGAIQVLFDAGKTGIKKDFLYHQGAIQVGDPEGDARTLHFYFLYHQGAIQVSFALLICSSIWAFYTTKVRFRYD